MIIKKLNPSFAKDAYYYLIPHRRKHPVINLIPCPWRVKINFTFSREDLFSSPDFLDASPLEVVLLTGKTPEEIQKIAKELDYWMVIYL